MYNDDDMKQQYIRGYEDGNTDGVNSVLTAYMRGFHGRKYDLYDLFSICDGWRDARREYVDEDEPEINSECVILKNGGHGNIKKIAKYIGKKEYEFGGDASCKGEKLTLKTWLDEQGFPEFEYPAGRICFFLQLPKDPLL